jgi:hypothetical protein
MALILFKWFIAAFLSTGMHPVYMSTTEIDHNAKEKTLEISCKIFTDDFEQALRKSHKQKIDLLNPKQKNLMNVVVNDYVQEHLKININGKPVKINFLGYEEIEEGIYSYFQAEQILEIKQISIKNNILYEYKSEQISLMHVTVNGIRKSTKLNNPAEHAFFSF